MAVASLAALALGMSLLICFPLSVQSVFELPGFLGSSFCSACNLGTYQAAFFHGELSPCWVGTGSSTAFLDTFSQPQVFPPQRQAQQAFVKCHEINF